MGDLWVGVGDLWVGVSLQYLTALSFRLPSTVGSRLLLWFFTNALKQRQMVERPLRYDLLSWRQLSRTRVTCSRICVGGVRACVRERCQRFSAA